MIELDLACFVERVNSHSWLVQCEHRASGVRVMSYADEICINNEDIMQELKEKMSKEIKRKVVAYKSAYNWC